MFHFFRKYKKGYSIEIEDISIDSIIQKDHKKSLISSQKTESIISERSFIGLFCFFVLSITILLGTCFYYQGLNANNFLVKAEKNRYIFNELNTQRGVIYDRNFNQLVSNSQVFSLYYIDAEEEAINTVCEILNIEKQEIQNQIQENESGFFVNKDLTEKEIILLKTKTHEIDGFEIRKRNIRSYDNNEWSFSHLLGYVSKEDGVGKDGIERQYEDILKEIPGQIKYERDVNNNILSEEIVEEPRSGKSLILNIDKDLQNKSSEVLKNAVDENGGKGGVVIIMNPKNGKILSLVSYPSYDNSLFSRSFSQKEYDQMLSQNNVSFFNRAIQGEYPIGSTIKPILATAFLEEDIIDPDTNINCKGGIELSDGSYKSDWKSHGLTNMRKAIAESCDVYYYILSGGYKDIKGLGINKIDEYLFKYGFGERTEIDLPGEEPGFVPTPEWKEQEKNIVWYPGDTYNISIGQGFLKATPIQVLIAISVIANNGKLVKPQIVKGIVDENKNIIEFYEDSIRSDNFINLENIKVVQEGMRQTVTSEKGTARSLSYLPFDCAAKTGTAETGTGLYHNWITVYGPYENPEIAMIVLVEDIPTPLGITNSIANEILKYYYNIDKRGNT